LITLRIGILTFWINAARSVRDVERITRLATGLLDNYDPGWNYIFFYFCQFSINGNALMEITLEFSQLIMAPPQPIKK
jgi:hypothetical protein